MPGQPTWLRIVSLAAVALGTGNVVGGFVVTDRMLEMFKPKKKREAERRTRKTRMSRTDWIYLAYLVTIVCFIVALQFLSHPARARNGNWIGAFGMAVAIVATFFTPHLTNYASILIVMAVAGADRGVRGARREDDRDAGDGGAVQRRRRRRGGARRARGLPQLDPGARPARLQRPRSRSSSPP